MMQITIMLLIACGIGPTQARIFEGPLQIACSRFLITTRARIAAFVAQASHESQGFTRLEENLYYSTAERILQVFPSRVADLADAARLIRNPQGLANRVYANKLGNGDEASGDGWRYRGRGLFQLTGRANYMAAGDAIGMDYKREPDLVGQPLHASLTAAWFFATIGGNELADSSQIDEITRKINGPARLALDERRSRFDHALLALA
jgi:putative chitinase